MDEPWNEESYLAMKTILSIYVKLWVAILIGDISAWEQEWSVVINTFYKAVFCPFQKKKTKQFSCILATPCEKRIIQAGKIIYILVNSSWTIT
jgi:hypothetical protein